MHPSSPLIFFWNIIVMKESTGLVGYFVFHYMWQLQQKDVIQTLPKPLPVSMVASYVSNKEEEDKVEDEHEEVGL